MIFHQVSRIDVKEKLQKCGKLEDLKTQLLQLNEAKKQIKKIKEARTKSMTKTTKSQAAAPELDKFEAIEVKVEGPSEPVR